MTATLEATKYTTPHQYWKWDVAIDYAHIYARLSGRRFTVRRAGTTNAGHPIWDIRPVTRQP